MEKVDLSSLPGKIPIGISCLDELTGGGLESEVITEIFGEGGAGKTNISMQFAISTIREGGQVLYLDTEGFSVERFLQISGGDSSMADGLILYRVSSLEDQDLAILRVPKILEKSRKVRLIIMDSFTEYFRLEASGDAVTRAAGFQKELSSLAASALKFRVPVLLTNQIYQSPDSGNLHPFGGYVIDHVMKAIYRVEKTKDGKRRLVVVKHRSIKEGTAKEFKITEYGLSCE
ncbi:MAG: DNA repair and recombination protein RadB [Candidatus Thermoplasmatota archaeon]|jgi:DNA repair protein RadB|nr:DNA repair and recombination protein RadB [Candidatus Thermoplasmatota archaeon]